MSLGLDSYRPPVMGATHAVSAGHYLSAAAGYRILEEGGNAIDAGVASGIVLNVVLPNATSFGGVAPIIIYLAESDSVVTISGLGRWPRAASAEYFVRNTGGEIPVGILRCVVPSAADAWLTALERYGTMTFEQVVAPALTLAGQGFPVSPYLRGALERPEEAPAGSRAPWASWPSSAEVFMPGGRLPNVGEMLFQRDLARSFSRLIEVERASAGLGREAALRAARDYFYTGDIAREMVAFSQEQGGFLTLEDLRDFSVRIEEPEVGQYKDYSVYTCGAWCQGPVVAQTLQMLEADDLRAMGHNSPDYVHLVSQALNVALADRHHFYGDPDFVDVPIKGLLSKEYARNRRSDIDMQRALSEMATPGDPWAYKGTARRHAVSQPVAGSAAPLEQDTSYTCVVDRWGNAFSATPSDTLFGSPLVPGLGFLISSRGSQTWLDPEHPSGLQPWKRPRLTPNPALAFKDGKLFMAFGTPGGDSQCSSMVQLFLNVVEFGMTPQQAIEQPRFAPWNFPNSFWPHAYHPGRLDIEGRVPKAVLDDLAKRGHGLNVIDDWSPAMGSLATIVVDQDSGARVGGADPRRETYSIAR